MIELKCDQPTFFDVDETLIMWNPTPEQELKHGIEYTSPEGHKQLLVPHIPNIEQLKKHSLRGHTIVVWSAGGSRWAAEAVKFLGLQAHVALTMAKPLWFYDDKQPEEFMGKPQYLKVQE